MRLTVLLLIIASLVLAAAWQRAPWTPDQRDGLVGYYDTDPAMNAAITRAQETLPLFLEAVLAGDRMDLSGALKVAFETFPTDVGIENIWIGDIRLLPDGTYQGRLNNQPVNLGQWQLNELVTFPASAIRDWSLESYEGLYGNFTTREIARRPGHEYLLDILAPSPLPEHWRDAPL